MESLLSYIQKHSRDSSQNVALVSPDLVISYAELLDRAQRLSIGFSGLGLRKAGVMAIAVDSPIQFVVCHLAAMCLGAVTAPVSPGLGTAELSRRLALLDPQLLVATRNITQVPMEPVSRIPKVVIDGPGPGVAYIEDMMNGSGSSGNVTELSDDEVTCIIFTSGVHAVSRAVRLTHKNLIYGAAQVGKALRVRPSDRVLSLHPFESIFGITLGVHVPLVNGSVAVIPQAGADMLHSWRTEDVTLAFVPAHICTKLASVSAPETVNTGSSLRCVVCTGGRVKADHILALSKSTGASIMSSYGSTETAGVVTLNLFPDAGMDATAGEPLSGMEVAIFDDVGAKLDAEKRGRIAVRGPTVMKSYIPDIPATGDVLITQDGWMITDDVGAIDYESQLVIYGHRNDCVMRGGFPVQSWEVEDVLATHDAVSEVVVTGTADSALGSDIRAWVVLRDGSSVSTTDLIEYAKSVLPVYKCPRVIRILKELPHLSDGRINKGLLGDERL